MEASDRNDHEKQKARMTTLASDKPRGKRPHVHLAKLLRGHRYWTIHFEPSVFFYMREGLLRLVVEVGTNAVGIGAIVFISRTGADRLR